MTVSTAFNNPKIHEDKEFLEFHKQFLEDLISDGSNSPLDMNTLQIAFKETEEALKNV